MPDWKEEVRRRLAALQLAAEVREEVIAELASHLEDSESESKTYGSPLSDAQWSKLCKAIQRKKDEEVAMNHRTKSLWIPGMVSLLGASLFMTALQWIGVRPRLLGIGQTYMIFYWPWIAALPIFGALGAYLSQRAGGERRSRMEAGLMPVLWLFLFSFVMMPLDWARQGFSLIALGYFALGMTEWVGIPGLALLTGTLPFLYTSSAANNRTLRSKV